MIPLPFSFTSRPDVAPRAIVLLALACGTRRHCCSCFSTIEHYRPRYSPPPLTPTPIVPTPAPGECITLRSRRAVARSTVAVSKAFQPNRADRWRSSLVLEVLPLIGRRQVAQITKHPSSATCQESDDLQRSNPSGYSDVPPDKAAHACRAAFDVSRRYRYVCSCVSRGQPEAMHFDCAREPCDATL